MPSASPGTTRSDCAASAYPTDPPQHLIAATASMAVRPQHTQNKQPPGMNPDGNLFGGGGGNRRTRYRSLDAPPKSRSTNKNPLNPTFGRASADLAVAVGFEPTVGLTPHNISSVAPSAARTRHREKRYPFASERERLGPQKRHQVQHSVDLATRGANLTECLRKPKRPRSCQSSEGRLCRSAGSVVSRSRIRAWSIGRCCSAARTARCRPSSR